MLASGVWKLCYSSFTSSPLKGILRSTWMKLRTMLDPLILSCLFALIQTYPICFGFNVRKYPTGPVVLDICSVLVARRALGRKKEVRPPACQWWSVPWYEGSGWSGGISPTPLHGSHLHKYGPSSSGRVKSALLGRSRWI